MLPDNYVNYLNLLLVYNKRNYFLCYFFDKTFIPELLDLLIIFLFHNLYNFEFYVYFQRRVNKLLYNVNLSNKLKMGFFEKQRISVNIR